MCMRGAQWRGSAGRHTEQLQGEPSSWRGMQQSCSASRHTQPPQRTSEARKAGTHWAPMYALNGSRMHCIQPHNCWLH